MAGISINDNLMMCLALHNWLVIVVKIHEWELWWEVPQVWVCVLDAAKTVTRVP